MGTLGPVRVAVNGDPEGAAAVLRAALEYEAKFGWTVFPLRRKKPTRKWKPLQTWHPGPTALRDLFSRRRYDALAVVCGSASGGLADRDWDVAEGYERWASAHPDLARLLPTAQTSRGYHVLHRTTLPDRHVRLPDGEYIADRRHYAVLPPSLHPSGIVYRWLVAPADEIPLVDDPVAAGLLPAPGADTPSYLSPSGVSLSLLEAPTAEEAGEEEEVKASPNHYTPTPRSGSGISTDSENSVTLGGLSAAVCEAVQATQPTGVGQRHNRLLVLARRLKGMPDVAEADLRRVALAWFSLAKAVVRTQNPEVSVADLVEAWRGVETPWVPASLAWAVADADANPLPVCAAVYKPGQARLIAVHAALQRAAGAAPYYLSDRDAAEVAGMSRAAAGWLQRGRVVRGQYRPGRFVRDGILELVKVGRVEWQDGQIVRKVATHYLYRGGTTA
jgi:hypothetical protein